MYFNVKLKLLLQKKIKNNTEKSQIIELLNFVDYHF